MLFQEYLGTINFVNNFKLVLDLFIFQDMELSHQNFVNKSRCCWKIKAKLSKKKRHMKDKRK